MGWLAALDWIAIGGAATVAQTIIVAATAIFGVVSIRQALKARRADALFRIMDEYHADQARADRRTVEQCPRLKFQAVSEENRASYDRLTEGFNRLGYLASAGSAPVVEILRLYNASIVANWWRLEPYVVSKRLTLGYLDYGRDFEALARAAERYIRRHQGDAQLRQVLDAAGYTSE